MHTFYFIYIYIYIYIFFCWKIPHDYWNIYENLNSGPPTPTISTCAPGIYFFNPLMHKVSKRSTHFDYFKYFSCDRTTHPDFLWAPTHFLGHCERKWKILDQQLFVALGLGSNVLRNRKALSLFEANITCHREKNGLICGVTQLAPFFMISWQAT